MIFLKSSSWNNILIHSYLITSEITWWIVNIIKKFNFLKGYKLNIQGKMRIIQSSVYGYC